MHFELDDVEFLYILAFAESSGNPIGYKQKQQTCTEIFLGGYSLEGNRFTEIENPNVSTSPQGNRGIIRFDLGNPLALVGMVHHGGLPRIGLGSGLNTFGYVRVWVE